VLRVNDSGQPASWSPLPRERSTVTRYETNQHQVCAHRACFAHICTSPPNPDKKRGTYILALNLAGRLVKDAREGGDGEAHVVCALRPRRFSESTYACRCCRSAHTRRARCCWLVWAERSGVCAWTRDPRSCCCAAPV